MSMNPDFSEEIAKLLRQMRDGGVLGASEAVEFQRLFMQLQRNTSIVRQSPLILPYAKTRLHIDIPH